MMLDFTLSSHTYNMKAETKWNLGNFTVALSTEATPEVDTVLRNLGLLYVGQRVSEVDKILGGFEKKGDKNVRIAGWKRADVDYTDSLRTALSAAFQELTLPDSEKKIECDVLVSRYDGPAKAEPKYAREKKKFAEKESTEAGLEAWLESFCGYTGETHGADGEYAVEALQSAKAAIDEFLAKNI